MWSADGKKYICSLLMEPSNFFEVNFPGATHCHNSSSTNWRWFRCEWSVGFTGENILVTHTDMNHASKYILIIWVKDLETTIDVNLRYSTLALSKTEKRYVTTTDGKKMLVLGGASTSTLQKNINTLVLPRRTTICIDSQFYSYRWNLQLMAANVYCSSSNRRGMPGHGWMKKSVRTGAGRLWMITYQQLML
jgi:hypothetical protein